MPEPKPLNATAAALLGLLSYGEMSGYELYRTADTVIGDYWTVTRSQVYRELAAMSAAGLVAAGDQGPRARRPFALTDEGRSAFAAWIVREPAPEVIRFPLLLTLNFGAWVGRDRALEFASRQRATHEQRLAGYLEVAAAAAEHGQPFIGATVAFGIHYERAVLAWMDELPDLLSDVPAEPTEP